MTDLWLPGAHIDPGVNAGYANGRSSMQQMVAHATVGSDSRGVGRRGYFNFLVHRDADRENGCTQYAEINAVTWHAFEPHRLRGPGVEFERLVTGGINDEGLSTFEDLTPNQIEWGHRIVEFAAEHGIVIDLYEGPRFQTDGWAGWVNHKDVDPSRSDGLTRAEWNLIVGHESSAAGDNTQESGLMWNVYYDNIDGTVSFLHGIGSLVAFKVVGQPRAYGLPLDELNYIGFNVNGITTRKVTPDIGFALEKTSNWLKDKSKDMPNM